MRRKGGLGRGVYMPGGELGGERGGVYRPRGGGGRVYRQGRVYGPGGELEGPSK